MNIDPSPHLKELHYTEILQLLSTACDWLTIRHGRATKYARLIKEFLGEDKRTREHILAYNESCEIIEFYEMWKVKVGNFPGIEHQIKSALNKGPILREDERAESSTNRPRNDAFVYLLAGKLMRAGIEVTAVDGTAVKGIGCHKDADITLDWNASIIDIECKRPQTEGALEGRVKKACDQLLNPSQSSPMGIIAIDCSAFIRPLGTLLEEDSAERAEVLLSRLLQEKISQKVQVYLEPAILGFLLFARAPAMIRGKNSPLLSPLGVPYRHMRLESISSTLGIINMRSSNADALRSICERLKQTLQ